MTATAPAPMNIGVFLSAGDLNEHYTQPTREVGELMGGGGHTLVWTDPIPGW